MTAATLSSSSASAPPPPLPPSAAINIPIIIAEFGPNVPQKLRSGINYFMHIKEDETPTPVEEEQPPVEPPKKKKRSRKSENTVAAEEEEVATTKKIKRVKVDSKHCLYTRGSAPLSVHEALIDGTILHLIKQRKYVRSLVYYDKIWFELK